MTIRFPIRAVAVCVQAALASVAQAQLIDDIDMRREGNNAVVQIRFSIPVQYQSSAMVRSGDVLQIFYTIQGSPDTFNTVNGERRIEGIPGLPGITVFDAFEVGSVTRRKMVLRFSESTRQQVRPGRDRQSIEVVLDGRGPALSAAFDVPTSAPAAQPAPAAAAPAPTPAAVAAAAAAAPENRGSYVVSLQRSATPQTQLAVGLPVEFQNKLVFASRRLVEGKPVFEVNLGYFPTAPLAEAARAKLLSGFPDANVMMVVSRAPAPAAAVAAVPAPAPTPAPAVVAAAPAPVTPVPATPAAVAAAPTPVAPAVPATVVAAAAPESRGNFVVNLQRSSSLKAQQALSLPAEFQNNQVFSSRRVVDGKPVQELNLGYFATASDAENARAKLLGSFPQATVMALVTRTAAAPATAAAAAPAPVVPAVVAAAAAATGAVVTAAASTATAATPAATTPAAVAPTPASTAAPASPPALALQTPSPAATATAIAAPVEPPAPAAETVVETTLISREALAVFNARGATLLAGARTAMDNGDYPTALETLNSLLNLPTNNSSRKGQELIGQVRLKLGDTARARSEYELFLILYPTGPDSDQVKKQLAALPKPAVVARVRPPMEPITVTNGSVSLYYFGGESQVRSQDFQNSPISGLPVLQSDSTISGSDIRMYQANTDLNWRYRDSDRDTRFVFRDSASLDQMPNGTNRNRLSALYFDNKSFVNGTNFRVGRQSPSGGGVMYRFDGLSAGYLFAPDWRINGTIGKPSDELLDTTRRFYGASIEAVALTPEISGNIYFNQGTVDGEIDRQAFGTEMRYFSGGVSLSGQFDYDTVLQGMNIASLQGSWLSADTTAVNFLYDRRSTPFRSLSNALFFQDPNQPTLARKISDLLQTNSIDTLRAQVNAITAMQTQGMAGITTPITKDWLAGANVTYVNVGAIAPVADILPSGQQSTGDLWSAGFQLIGSNLYSTRDSHVYNLSLLSGPTYNGRMLSYNNLSRLTDKWQLEPSIRYYTQTDNTDTTTVRWTPGLRVTYRMQTKVTLESEATYEISTINGPLTQQSSTRLFYYLGGRYEF